MKDRETMVNIIKAPGKKGEAERHSRRKKECMDYALGSSETNNGIPASGLCIGQKGRLDCNPPCEIINSRICRETVTATAKADFLG